MPLTSTTRTVWSPSAVSVASIRWSYGGTPCPRRCDSSVSLVVTRSRCGGSHASTRPVASASASTTCTRNRPPRRRSPSTWPYHVAKRPGSVRADHSSSIPVLYRYSTRTTPLPPADRTLPRTWLSRRGSLVIHCSFVRVPAVSLCQGARCWCRLMAFVGWTPLERVTHRPGGLQLRRRYGRDRAAPR